MGALIFLSAVTTTASAERALHVDTASARARAGSVDIARLANHDVELRARLALARVSPLAARSPAASIVATSTDRFGDGDAIVHFEQSHRGLPVVGRGAAVRLSKNGGAVLASVDLEESLPDTTPSIAAADAARAAARVVALGADADDAHLVVWPVRGGGGARLAYVVLPKVPTGLPTMPRIVVDAMTGKVIEATDLVRFAKASVYRSNPTKSTQVEDLDLAIAPSSEKLTSDVITSANCIDKKTVKKVNMFGFNTNMHICDIEQVATANGSGDFLYTPADEPGSLASKSDEFSEVSMYFHTARAYDFFRTLQGAPTATVVKDKPIRVVANLQIPAGVSSGNFAQAADPNTPLEPFSNAFYSPAGGQLGALFQQLYGLSGGGLWFGQGPQRDYAYDGDVVYHELTHAVVDATLRLGAWSLDARGAIDAPGAMNEGLADYFSSAITGDPDVGEYASKDLASGQSVIRTLGNKDKCPSELVGEVHLDSTLFSGGLWQARSALPEADRSKFDAALYKAMRSNPGRDDVGFEDLTKLFLATLKTDLPAGAAALESAMTSRGVLPACERIFEWNDAPIRPFVAGVGGFAAPGIQSLGLGGDTAPGMLQVHAKLPAGASKVTLSFTVRAGGGGASPIGGGGTPFTPVVLAKAGKPITWTYTGGVAAHDADSAVDGVTDTRTTATVDVAEGTTDLYLQIASKGESDGNYDDLQVQITSAAPAPGTQDPNANRNVGSQPAVDDGGCGCSTPGSTTNGSLPLAGLVAALGVVAAGVRRRRR